MLVCIFDASCSGCSVDIGLNPSDEVGSTQEAPAFMEGLLQMRRSMLTQEISVKEAVKLLFLNLWVETPQEWHIRSFHSAHSSRKVTVMK